MRFLSEARLNYIDAVWLFSSGLFLGLDVVSSWFVLGGVVIGILLASFCEVVYGE